jgi:hypothetical protein
MRNIPRPARSARAQLILQSILWSDSLVQGTYLNYININLFRLNHS